MKTLFHLYNKEHTCLQAHTCLLNLLNPFVPNAAFLYPLKTLQNRKVFWCFQGVEKGCFGNEWVKEHDYDTFLFSPVKVAETFNFFFRNIAFNIAKTCYFYATTPDEIIKIIKIFSNKKSSGPESLPTPILKNCADVTNFHYKNFAIMVFGI